MGDAAPAHLRWRGVYGCAAGRRICTVWPDGQVTPCSFLADLSAGNVCQMPFAELWARGEGWERLRDPGPTSGRLRRLCHRFTVRWRTLRGPLRDRSHGRGSVRRRCGMSQNRIGRKPLASAQEGGAKDEKRTSLQLQDGLHEQPLRLSEDTTSPVTSSAVVRTVRIR